MAINRKFFFDTVRARLFGGRLTAKQVEGMTAILDVWEKEFWNQDDRILAYCLATAYHETDKTMQPIREYGGKAYFIRRYWDNVKIRKQLGNRSPEDAYLRSGRGQVQLTGYSNDVRATKEIREQCPELVRDFECRTQTVFDIVAEPAQALDLKVSVAVLLLGSIQGWFTGRKLTQFFTETVENWVKARSVINGRDKENLIADHAKKFYSAISYTN